jgi:GTP-binding protein
VATLLDFTGRHHWVAENGRPGEGQNRTGRGGRDLEIHLPAGTLVYDRDSGRLLKDLDTPGARVRIAQGGRGGKGNDFFKSSRNQTPRYAQPGEEAEERWLRLELKLIADVGLVGLPNAGKSTLLSRVSKAQPKIADYPFTTLEPQLGIVELPGYRRFVMADLPGLIEGAHEGVGLGDDFLRHVERTRVLVHLLDAYPMEGQPSAAEAYRTIRRELRKYSDKLADKPEIIVANKIDLSDNTEAVEALREKLGCDLLAVSGVTGAGLDGLCERIWEVLERMKKQEASAIGTDPTDDPFKHVPLYPRDDSGKPIEDDNT